MMSFLIPAKINQAAINWCVACSPGWNRKCKALKMVRRSEEGTNGRGVLLLTSKKMLVEQAGNDWSGREVMYIVAGP